MRKYLAILALTLATFTNAHAWGPREQGALAGIAATLIFQHMNGAQAQAYPQYPQQQPQIIMQQPPVIMQQPPVIIHQPPVIIYPHGHRHSGYYQVPDPRVYSPQIRY